MIESPMILFGNGEVPSHPIVLSKIESVGTIICLDGGTDKLIDLGYKPTCIIGDLDSLSKKPEDYGCEFIALPEQSKSDLEKGLEWCLDKGIKNISLIGFSGLRDDHHTAALFALKSFSEKMDITMLTNHSAIRCIKGTSKFRVYKGQLISILASQSDTLVRTTGLKYELSNEKLLSPGNGISNFAISNHIEIDSNDWVWIFINHME
tara:strand:+ start:981 stop:1601 length:621 start_codon:yes stop_codon:yes gene_type:complete